MTPARQPSSRSLGASSRAWGSPPGHPWRPEDAPEVGPEETALFVLEGRLADIRRLLVGAARIRCPLHGEVAALAGLAAELHHRVLEDLERPAPKSAPGGAP